MKTVPVLAATTLAALFNLSPGAELRHFWNFDGATPYQDKAGAANGSVTEFTSVLTTTGHDGNNAANFGAGISGADDWVAIDTTSIFEPLATAFSMSFWVRLPDDGAGVNLARGIFDFSGNGGDGIQSLFIGSGANANRLAFRIDGDFGAGTSDNALALVPMTEDGLWHFIAATYDPALGLEVHLDGYTPGGSAAAGPVQGSVPMNATSYLGAFNFTGATADKGLNGDLDDVAIYSGVLTEAEITGLFAGTVSPLDLLPTSAPSLTAVIHNPVTGAVTIFWDSAADRSYSLWGSTDLTTWTELDPAVAGNGTEQSVTNTPPDSPADFYYQVRPN